MTHPVDLLIQDIRRERRERRRKRLLHNALAVVGCIVLALFVIAVAAWVGIELENTRVALTKP